MFQHLTYADPLDLKLVPGIDRLPTDEEIAMILLGFGEQNVILLVDHKSEFGVLRSLKITTLSDDQKVANLVRCNYLYKIKPTFSQERCDPLK
jgi:hypothetical protein